MIRFIILSGLIILFAFFGFSLAEIPKLINYQGMLTDNSGNPLSGAYNLTFKIYDDTTGGTLRWSEIQSGVSVQNGLFNVILGRATVLDLAFDESYWLEVQVGDEIMPRLRFTSVGYAYRAKIADSATVAVSTPSGGGWTDEGRIVKLQTNSDSVCIGGTNPQAKLHVSGDINVDSLYKIGGKTVLSISGFDNVFVGEDAGKNNSEQFGTFMGYKAGYDNSGRSNTFIGLEAGYHTSGDANTFVGELAGFHNASGSQGTFVGRYAGYYNTSGWNNTFIGEYTGKENTTGGSNTYLGISAGEACSTGSWNTFVGSYAGFSNGNGTGNVFIGYESGFSETGSNKLYIANGPDDDNVLIYGDFSTGNMGIGTIIPQERLHVKNYSNGGRSFIQIEASHASNWGETGLRIKTPQNTWHLRSDDATNNNIPDGSLGLRSQDLGSEVMVWSGDGKVGIGTTGPTEKLDVNGTVRLRGITSGSGTTVQADANGKLWKQSSSKRYKENIRELNVDFNRVLQLKPVQFRWKTSGDNDIGLIAEDVEGVLPNLVLYDTEGKPDAVKYDKVTLYLLEMLRAQQERIMALENEMAKLKK